MNLSSGLVANALVLAVIATYAAIERADADLFYTSVQEDEWLEWATVWAFVAAAGLFGTTSWRRFRAGARPLPWFLAGLGLFCLWVALEEISWGQRLLGYRPPSYFLEHNYQQEFNLHNVLESDLRKLAVKAVLLGYGVLLPLASLSGWVRHWLGRLAIEAPPIALIPSFLGTYALYETYPLRFTGEIVELMMGLGFAFSALASLRASAPSEGSQTGKLVRPLLGSVVLVAVLAGASSLYTQRLRSVSPEAIAAAQVELAALRADFREELRRGTRWLRGCGMHRRLYTAQARYGWRFLGSGRFAQLTSEGLSQERAEFLLDPWNYPYWIRDNCDDPDRRIIFVYSFGPNRLRDSTRREIRSDDLGTAILGAVSMPQHPFMGQESAQDPEASD